MEMANTILFFEKLKERFMQEFLKEVVSVLPSKRQLDWFDLGSYAFIHFGPNTYTGNEWGTGNEAEEIFNPAELDCDQWVYAIKSAGLKGLIITAKHHDGFCLWPSKYTEHSVKNSLYKKDVVREASEACKRGGIKFGFYLSPWDRNSALYGQPEYNDYYCNQLTELLTQYGDIFCIWFDNACGEGPNGKRQEYDFERYIKLVRKYQPNAVIFNDFGPDIRWCGNEEGIGRNSEWAVVPKELCKYSEAQTGPAPLSESGDLSYLKYDTQNLGTLDAILFSKGLTFTPAEIDVSIRTGWFWHEEEEPHSLEKLFNIYLNSVGNNSCLNLNVPLTEKV
jgi:alpha-L-fucosidase